MPTSLQSRDRGRILTPEALARLEQGIQQWQQQNDQRLTYERWRGLTSEITPGGLDPTTLSKIRKGKVKVDRDSIRIALESLGLTLQESDLISFTPSVGLSVPDPNFVGRDKVLTEIDKLFERNRLVLILGEGGLGKSTVARFYSRKFEPNADFYKLGTVNSSEIANAESLVDRWLQEFFSEEPSRQEFSIKLARLRKYLEKDKRRICFVLDNLEPALENGKFKAENEHYVNLLEVLSDPLVHSITLITSREPINEIGIRICTYPLPELDAHSWYEYFQYYQIQVSEESLTDPDSAIKQMHKAYGGNAECMSVLSGDIVNSREYDNDLESYWAANCDDLLNHPTIEGLIQRQFEILQRDNLLAYQLLCRMGCYRYQDAVVTVPEEGIMALLWEDEAKSKAKRTLKNLRDRCLIKFSEQDKGYFLHPVMRAEAVSRLKDNCGNWTEEGIEAHRKAAVFFENHISDVLTVQDALIGFEILYHYLEISDYIRAAAVIFEIRSNSVGDIFDNFGFVCWRLGFSKEIIKIISSILQSENQVNDVYHLSGMYRILGYSENQLGNIYKAIEYHEKSGYLANRYIKKVTFDNSNSYQKNIRDMICAYLFNTGLCYFDIWEIQQAHDYFELAVTLSTDLEKDRYGVEDNCHLALTKAILGFLNEAEKITKKSYQKYLLNESVSAWGKAYIPLILGKTYRVLGDISKSFEMYKLALSESDKIYYKQARGSILCGLAEIYRELQNFELALSYHIQSAKILEHLEAKCDLAETYFQLGLTYQAMAEHDQSEKYKNKAIELFTQMEAPKQIERVNQAFQVL